MADNDPQLPTLAVTMAKKEDIPEMYQELYVEKDGKWVLTGIAGVKTQTDIDRLQAATATEREAHKKTKGRFGALNELNDDQLREAVAWLDKRQEIEAKLEAAGKAPNETEIEKQVQSRLNSQLAPLQREKGELATKLAEAEKVVAELQEEKRIRIIHDSIRGQRTDSKYIDTAEEDILMVGERMLHVNDEGEVVTKEGVGVTPGIAPKEWLIEMRPKRPHWFPETEGGGAKGSKGSSTFPNNPWTTQFWNKTHQSKIYGEDPAKAEAMARAAGTTVFAAHPPKKG